MTTDDRFLWLYTVSWWITFLPHGSFKVTNNHNRTDATYVRPILRAAHRNWTKWIRPGIRNAIGGSCVRHKYIAFHFHINPRWRAQISVKVFIHLKWLRAVFPCLSVLLCKWLLSVITRKQVGYRLPVIIFSLGNTKHFTQAYHYDFPAAQAIS